MSIRQLLRTNVLMYARAFAFSSMMCSSGSIRMMAKVPSNYHVVESPGGGYRLAHGLLVAQVNLLGK